MNISYRDFFEVKFICSHYYNRNYGLSYQDVFFAGSCLYSYLAVMYHK